MSLFVDALSWIFLLLGSFFCISGGVGVLRFPDFFSRMHAAGVTDTLGAGCIVLGLLLQSEWNFLVIVKLLLIIAFLYITSPTASHALAKAALHGGLVPWEKNSSEESDQQERSQS